MSHGGGEGDGGVDDAADGGDGGIEAAVEEDQREGHGADAHGELEIIELDAKALVAAEHAEE